MDWNGDLYGEAKESAFTAALRALAKSGEIEHVTRGKKPHQHVIRKVAWVPKLVSSRSKSGANGQARLSQLSWKFGWRSLT